MNGLPLGPVVEPDHFGSVITGKSYDLLKNGIFNEVPIMIGHTSLEALSIVSKIIYLICFLDFMY